MDNVIDVINNLSSFIQYFATGFLFFSAYSFAGCLQREMSEIYFIVKSITASFVIDSIVGTVFNITGLDNQYYFFALVIVSGVSGLLLGRARSFTVVNKVSEKLFRHTITDNIFQTICDSVSEKNSLFIRFNLKNSDNIYEGQVEELNSIYTDPILLIRYYLIKDKTGNVDRDRDFSVCDCAKLIVKWSDMINIEVASEGWLGDSYELSNGK